MPLDYAEFAHHYEGLGMNDMQRRAHFEIFADLMECLMRLFWREGAGANALGISLDGDTLTLADAVDSGHTLASPFNAVALPKAAGKQET